MKYKLVSVTNHEGNKVFFPYIKKWWGWVALYTGGVETKKNLCVEYDNQDDALKAVTDHFAKNKKPVQDLVLIQVLKACS